MYEKIKEYLDNFRQSANEYDHKGKLLKKATIGISTFIDKNKMAKDITEIVEKENKSNWTIEKILKENVDLKNRIKPLEDKINMLKAKCFRLRQTRMAYQSLADKRYEIIAELEKEISALKSKISKLEKNEEIYHKRLKVNRDKIIEVLRKNLEKGFKTTISGSSENGNYSSFTTYFPKQLFEFIETIADEIMKGN